MSRGAGRMGSDTPGTAPAPSGPPPALAGLGAFLASAGCRADAVEAAAEAVLERIAAERARDREREGGA